MIFILILLTIHKISYYKVRVSRGVETRWLVGSFVIVYRTNTGRLGSGLISVCLETRWLSHSGGFYVPERPCSSEIKLGLGGFVTKERKTESQRLGFQN